MPTAIEPNYVSKQYRKIHFAVMAIESGSALMGIPAHEMYHRLDNQGLVSGRLFKFYDTLHTQSLEYVAKDIVETLNNWENE